MVACCFAQQDCRAARVAISEYTEGGGVGEQLTANYPFTAASFNASTPTAIGNLGNVFANAVITQPCPDITVTCYNGPSRPNP